MDERTPGNILSAKGIIVGCILMAVGFWVKNATIAIIGEVLILVALMSYLLVILRD